MNQEKIGKFILELRKEKNMTQMELAEKIGVTDRAISKWENGRGMPDLSLLFPLCKELGVTINDLLSGERIDKNNYQDKLEENILNTIDYTDKKLKRSNKKIRVIFGSIMSLILIFIILFFVDIKRMNNNKPVLFSTWGFKYAPPIDLHEDEIEIAIKDYLVEKSDHEVKYNGEKTFVSMRIYLLEEIKKDKLYYVYAWVREGKYYLENDEIKEVSSSSIPHKIIVGLINDKYKVIDSIIPRDGSLYSVDMKNIFPKSVRKDMELVYIDGTLEKLQLDINEQLKLYFHK